MKHSHCWERVKVMKLDHWMTHRFAEETLKYYLSTDPIFNRNGIYCYKGSSWFEMDGKAWLYEPNQFLYDINLEPTEFYREDVYKALVKLKHENLLSEKQKENLFKFENWMLHRAASRNTRLHRLRVISKILKKDLTSLENPVK